MEKKTETPDRILVWKNLRLIVKEQQSPQAQEPNKALLVLVGADGKTHE